MHITIINNKKKTSKNNFSIKFKKYCFLENIIV